MAEVIERPDILKGTTIRGVCGCGKLYVTINELNGKPIEVFVNLGKSGSCANTVINSTAIIISHGLRAGVPLVELATALLGMKCERRVDAVMGKGLPRHSCMDALSKIFLEYLKSKGVIGEDFEVATETTMVDEPVQHTEPQPPPEVVTERKIDSYSKAELKKLSKEKYIELLGKDCGRVRIFGIDECIKCLNAKCRYRPEEASLESDTPVTTAPVTATTTASITVQQTCADCGAIIYGGIIKDGKCLCSRCGIAPLPQAPQPTPKADKKKVKEEASVIGGMTCKKCGGQVVMEGACDRCVSCGYSKKCGG